MGPWRTVNPSYRCQKPAGKSARQPGYQHAKRSRATRAASQHVESESLLNMIRENLVSGLIACEHYRELIRYFADKGSTTRVMMESILTTEEEHADDMLDLLAAHEGRPKTAGSAA